MKISLPSLFAVVFASTTLPAQTPPPVPPVVTQEEAVVLTPFTVNSSLDQGYAALQTMSGSRLATNLRDVASVISAITPDYLKDIDATNLQQAILFTPGTDEDPRAYNSQANNPVSTRIRGFLMTGNTQNFFPNDLTNDMYNIDRVDINRGPNSILYGIGSPGGGFTATTKDARFRNFGEIETRFDQFDSSRYTLDLNRQILPKRLAVRVAALTQDQRQFRTPAANRENRLYVAANLKLVNREAYVAGVRAQAERQYARASIASWQTPFDYISTWTAAGAPTWKTAALVVGTFPTGMAQMANNSNIIVTTGGTPSTIPTFVFGRRASSAVTQIPGTTLNARLGVPGVALPLIPGTNRAVPVTLNYWGPARGFTQEAESQSVFLEQTLFNKVFTELAYYRQDSKRNWIREGGGADLRVDVLELLPNGQPNPNVGRLYTDGLLRDQPQQTKNEILRFTGSTEWDLTKRNKWLGRHRFGMLLEKSDGLFALNDRYEVNLRATQYQNNLVTAANRIVRRSYLFQGLGDVWQAGTAYRDIRPLSGTVDSASVSQAGATYQSGLVNQRIQGNMSKVRAWVASMQSFFLQDRLMVFGGIRGDKLSSFALDQTFVAANTRAGVLPDWQAVPFVTDPTSALDGRTSTVGIIARPQPWLDLFFNKSNVLAPGTARPDVYNRPLPFPTGYGWDAGLRWSLLNARLTGSFSYYVAAQRNSMETTAQVIITQLQDFADGLTILAAQTGSGVPAGSYSSLAVVGGTNAVDTSDNDAHGFDTEMIFNPVPNWRWSVKFSRTLNKNSNMAERTLAYFNEKIYPLRTRLPGAAVLPTSGKTLSEAFLNFDREFNSIKYSREDTLAQRLSEWSGSLVTNYSFRQGRLKGVSVGGWFRYNSEPYLNALLNPATGVFTGKYVRGPRRTMTGLNLGYTRKLMARLTLDVRLSLNNLLDRDANEPIQADATTGAITSIRPVAPRSWALTTGIKF